MSMVMKKPFNSYTRIMQAISASLVQSGNVVTWEKGISGQLGHEDMVKLVGYGHGSTPVYLNVYDLTPMNGYAYWVGLGIFHSVVEVHGVEYAFGAHDYLTNSVIEVEPF
ncbi:hypothetical protein VitviT2T_028550 [Vitis vinifera]|uniref:PPPDE domain-containing protein n=1 Tax=Vitis vinifera TaxID=29760 RepID=A0ABY9DTG3_VITVI|nr:hypothetical protein VitviT2T_028550 [Vitis vinifera]